MKWTLLRREIEITKNQNSLDPFQKMQTISFLIELLVKLFAYSIGFYFVITGVSCPLYDCIEIPNFTDLQLSKLWKFIRDVRGRTFLLWPIKFEGSVGSVSNIQWANTYSSRFHLKPSSPSDMISRSWNETVPSCLIWLFVEFQLQNCINSGSVSIFLSSHYKMPALRTGFPTGLKVNTFCVFFYWVD